MSKLLINGCSYTTNWSPSCQLLGNKLNFESTVNLSLSGSSNDRIFRSTLEYIFNNSVDFVILSLTFMDRQEAPWGKDIWTDYSPMGVMRPSELLNDEKLYTKYIQDRYRYDVDMKYTDKLVNNIITFSGWLDHKKIRYVIFSSPGGYFENADFGFINQNKLIYLNKNPRIIDIENWSANQYIHDNGGTSFEQEGTPSGLHYTPDSYPILNNFLYDYIIKHDL